MCVLEILFATVLLFSLDANVDVIFGVFDDVSCVIKSHGFVISSSENLGLNDHRQMCSMPSLNYIRLFE